MCKYRAEIGGGIPMDHMRMLEMNGRPSGNSASEIFSRAGKRGTMQMIGTR